MQELRTDNTRPILGSEQSVPVTLRMKCPNCDKWNNVKAAKVVMELDNEEPKMQIFLPTYLPLKTEDCSNASRWCG